MMKKYLVSATPVAVHGAGEVARELGSCCTSQEVEEDEKDDDLLVKKEQLSELKIHYYRVLSKRKRLKQKERTGHLDRKFG